MTVIDRFEKVTSIPKQPFVPLQPSPAEAIGAGAADALSGTPRPAVASATNAAPSKTLFTGLVPRRCFDDITPLTRIDLR